jgi:hypothetical protein
MAYKCWGCNDRELSVFAWLRSDVFCSDCVKKITDPVVSANYKKNSKESAERHLKRVERNNNMFGIQTPEQRAAAGRAAKQVAVSTIPHTSTSIDALKLIGGIAVVLFFFWMIFGGLLEDQSSYNAQNTVNIDCRQPGWSNSPYCNGEYDSQMQQQDANENNYYQNIAR